MITFNELGNYGRLGNQLFQISSTIGYAKKFNYDFGFSSSWKYRKYFKNQLPCYDIKLDKFYYQNETEFQNIGDNISLMGHFQFEKYFKNCEQLIQYYFEPKNIFSLPDNYCFIHFRRDDYISQNNNLRMRSNMPSINLSLEYYKKSIEYINNINSECVYIVCSDDILWCKNNLKSFYNLNNKIIFSESDEMDDLFMMSNCDYAIIANSSYSWWGAWLGKEKIVLGPAHGPSLFEYPEKWIKITY